MVLKGQACIKKLFSGLRLKDFKCCIVIKVHCVLKRLLFFYLKEVTGMAQVI